MKHLKSYNESIFSKIRSSLNKDEQLAEDILSYVKDGLITGVKRYKDKRNSDIEVFEFKYGMDNIKVCNYTGYGGPGASNNSFFIVKNGEAVDYTKELDATSYIARKIYNYLDKNG